MGVLINQTRSNVVLLINIIIGTFLGYMKNDVLAGIGLYIIGDNIWMNGTWRAFIQPLYASTTLTTRIG